MSTGDWKLEDDQQMAEDKNGDWGLFACRHCGLRILVPVGFVYEGRLHQRCPVKGQQAPSLVERVKQFREARRRWIGAGRPRRTPERIKEIRNTLCQLCKNFDKKHQSCGICGCWIREDHRAFLNKLAWATERCPDNPPKWVEEIGSEMKIFWLGYPGTMGGANTECWHTVRLFREAGWQVHMIPTWGHDAAQEAKLTEIGVTTHHVQKGHLEDAPGLAGSIVVGMCNSHFCEAVGELRGLGCRLVWIPCMNFQFGHELHAWTKYGTADAYMFQSQFQMERFHLMLSRMDYQKDQGFLIHGAFYPDEFPFQPQPHEAGSEFVIGRLSRPDLDKWSSNTWPIYERVPYHQRKAVVMGWNEELEGKLGKPPEWATALAPQAESVLDFLRRCHCLVQINGGAIENWPRVGLEAMAAGVPLIVQNAGGWREMIEHGKTGFLCDTDEDLAYWPAHLARNENQRLEVARAARAAVEEFSDPEVLIEQWRKLFDFVKVRS